MLHRRAGSLRGTDKTDSRPTSHVTANCSHLHRTQIAGGKGQFLHQDTPPNAFARDRYWWQVSWLAGPRFRPPSQAPSGTQWHFGRKLAAYSCGGSRGVVTAFPFDPLREPPNVMLTVAVKS